MFRGQSWMRRVGVALVLLGNLGVESLALPHADDPDAQGVPFLAAHDASAHHVGAATQQGTAETEHCFLCHSLRSFYPAFDKFEQPHYAPPAEQLPLVAIDRARLLAGTLAPGRAPPL